MTCSDFAALSLSLSLSGCSSVSVALLLCYCCCRCWLSGTCCFARTYWLAGGTQHGEAPQNREFSTHKKKKTQAHVLTNTMKYNTSHTCVWYTKTEREEKNVASWFFNTSAQLAPSKTHNCNTNEASRGRRSRRRHNTQFEISLSLSFSAPLSLLTQPRAAVEWLANFFVLSVIVAAFVVGWAITVLDCLSVNLNLFLLLFKTVFVFKVQTKHCAMCSTHRHRQRRHRHSQHTYTRARSTHTEREKEESKKFFLFESIGWW